MLNNYQVIYEYGLQRHAELIREAELERQARLAVGPRRPLRLRIADALYALAERVEGRGRGRAQSRARAIA